MVANHRTLLFIFSCALVAQAQNSTTTSGAASATSGLDACIIGCVSNAATSNGCSSYTDLPCVCTSIAFQQAAAACLAANCTAAEIATANQLQTQECAALSTGVSSTTTATATSTSTSTTATSATPASTSKSGAMAYAPLSFGTVICTLLASAGALVGAAFVL